MERSENAAPLSLSTEKLLRLVRNWELEAQALETVWYRCQGRAEKEALRDCASVYRKCAADLMAWLKAQDELNKL